MEPNKVDEKNLKAAINNLMYLDVTPKLVKIIVDGVNLSQITKEIWHEQFNKEGAAEGVKVNFSNPSMGKLLTLRAIILPETLTELLGWLKYKKNRHYRQTCLTFVEEFCQEVITGRREVHGLKENCQKVIEALKESNYNNANFGQRFVASIFDTIIAL